MRPRNQLMTATRFMQSGSTLASELGPQKGKQLPLDKPALLVYIPELRRRLSLVFCFEGRRPPLCDFVELSFARWILEYLPLLFLRASLEQ